MGLRTEVHSSPDEWVVIKCVAAHSAQVLVRWQYMLSYVLFSCTGIRVRSKVCYWLTRIYLSRTLCRGWLVPTTWCWSIAETNGGVLMHLNFDSFIIIVIFLFGSRDAKRRDFSVSESIVLWYFLCIFSVKIRECNVTSEYKPLNIASSRRPPAARAFGNRQVMLLQNI